MGLCGSSETWKGREHWGLGCYLCSLSNAIEDHWPIAGYVLLHVADRSILKICLNVGIKILVAVGCEGFIFVFV